MILSFARGTVFAPGSNRQGAAAPPSWAYLLPRLSDLRVVPVGHPDERLLEGLADWNDVGGRDVLLLIGDASGDDVRAALEEHPGAAVFAAAPAAADVLAALETAAPAWLAPATDSGGGGSGGGVAGGGRRGGEAGAPAAAGDTRTPLWVRGDAPGAAGRFAKLQAKALRVSGRLLRRAGLAGASVGAADDPTGVPLAPVDAPPADAAARALFVPPPGADVRRVPEWIAEAAGAAGVDLAAAPWRMVPSRGYRSQKILFLVRSRAGDGVAVKITQDPRFNVRLANEHAGLAALAALPGVPAGTFPRPLFRAEHRGLVVVGEDAVDGEPFRGRCAATPDCPLAVAAMDWLETVATASARPAPGGDVADAAGELVERFLSIYSPGEACARMLHADLERLRTSGGVPTVLTHGDPGVWNLLVAPGGRVAVLDWENADPRGLPLWDLLYFLRTLGALAAEKGNVRWTPSVFARQFLDEGEWSALLARRADAMLRKLGAEVELAPALLRTGLAAFAAREAWSLDPDRLEHGVSLRLLRAVVGRGDGLRLGVLQRGG